MIPWGSLIIILEILYTLAINRSSLSAIQQSKNAVLIFLIPITILFILCLLFLVSTSRKNGLGKAISANLLKRKGFAFFAFTFITFFLLLSSVIYFIIIDTIPLESRPILTPFALLGFLAAWQVIILAAFTHKDLKPKPKFWIGLPILIAINYYLWHTLVNVDRYLEPYYAAVYANTHEEVFSTFKWWQFMLPIEAFGGFWASGSIFTHFVQEIISISGAWHLYQLILILTAFFLSRKVFRSIYFSYLLPICLVFGTHYYHAFQYSSISAYYLLHTLFLLLLYLAYQFIRGAANQKLTACLYTITLLITAIFTEGWLDFFASLWAISILLFSLFRNRQQSERNKRLVILFIITNIIAAVYIYLKFNYIGFIHTSGESKVIFTYGIDQFWLMLEDFISNYLTHLYMTLTNFLPPAFITSNALYQYNQLLDKGTTLISGHYIFLWRYLAGILALVFFYALVKVIKKVFQDDKLKYWLPLAVFMLMVAVNSPTHTIVVYHKFKAMPALGYHVEQGVLGMSLAIACLFYIFEHTCKNKKRLLLGAVITVLVILYGSIRRPNYLWHMIEVVGLAHQGPYPNPLATLIIKIRTLFPGFLGR